MIRRLEEADRDAAVALLAQSPQMNLYMLGNIETLGFSHEVCEFWGDVSGASGGLRALINRYMSGWTVWGRADADWRGLAEVVDRHPVAAERLQDNPGGIESFLPFSRRYRAAKDSIEEVMSLAEVDFCEAPTPEGATIRRATLADLDVLTGLYADAGHMRRSPAQVERPLRNTRIWVAEVPGQIPAGALTNAETSESAMIGGVYTAPHMRGLGLSSAVCGALCRELLAERKLPVLYWETPAAAAVYRKLGFRAVGKWRSIRLERANG